MSDSANDPVKDAWNGLGDALTQLGQAMKDRYLGAGGAGGAGEAATEPAAAAEAEPDGPPPGGASTDGLRDALERFVAAGRDVGQRATDVMRDPGVNTQARNAASSLTDALQATVDVVGREVAGWFGSPKPVADDTTDGAVIDVDPEDGPPT